MEGGWSWYKNVALHYFGGEALRTGRALLQQVTHGRFRLAPALREGVRLWPSRLFACYVACLPVSRAGPLSSSRQETRMDRASMRRKNTQTEPAVRRWGCVLKEVGRASLVLPHPLQLVNHALLLLLARLPVHSPVNVEGIRHRVARCVSSPSPLQPLRPLPALSTLLLPTRFAVRPPALPFRSRGLCGLVLRPISSSNELTRL